MEFFKTIYKNEVVFFINNEIIDDILIEKILSNSQNKKIGLDMKKVKTISSKLFINCLKQEKFKLFNLKSEVLAYLSIIFQKGFLKSYMNFEDFKNNKRELFKRRFKTV